MLPKAPISLAGRFPKQHWKNIRTTNDHRAPQRRISPAGEDAGLAAERGRGAGAALWPDRDRADPAAQDRRLQEAGGTDQRADEASGLMSDWHAIASIDISRKLRPFQIPHEPGRDPAFMWSP